MMRELGAQESVADEISLILGAKAVIDGLDPDDPDAPNVALWAILTVAEQPLVHAYFEALRRSHVPGWYKAQ